MLFVGEASHVIVEPFPVPRQAKLHRKILNHPLLPVHLFVLQPTPLLVYLKFHRFSYHDAMEEDFMNSQGWNTGNEWIDPRIFQTPGFWNNDFPFIPQDPPTSSNTPAPSSSDSRSDTPLETVQNPKSRKRRQISDSPQPDALIRPRKTRIIRAPQDTAKVREMGACLTCKRKRKEVRHICMF